jgi:hypothetical protein
VTNLSTLIAIVWLLSFKLSAFVRISLFKFIYSAIACKSAALWPLSAEAAFLSLFSALRPRSAEAAISRFRRIKFIAFASTLVGSIYCIASLAVTLLHSIHCIAFANSPNCVAFVPLNYEPLVGTFTCVVSLSIC